MLIGEFGSYMKTAGDRAWMKALIAFLKRPVAEGRVAWTYWSWNPNSGDTGGLLTDDWKVRTPTNWRPSARCCQPQVRTQIVGLSAAASRRSRQIGVHPVDRSSG